MLQTRSLKLLTS